MLIFLEIFRISPPSAGGPSDGWESVWFFFVFHLRRQMAKQREALERVGGFHEEW